MEVFIFGDFFFLGRFHSLWFGWFWMCGFFFFFAVDRQQRPIYVVWVGLATVGDWVGSNLCGLVGFGCGLR